ncbi:hypothetical protein AB0O64_24025 [Streptomyces sp. NPDC088341]
MSDLPGGLLLAPEEGAKTYLKRLATVALTLHWGLPHHVAVTRR